MATIKSYTNLEQSKKLVEILPLESADMCYLPTHIGDEHHFIASLSPYSVCTKMTDVSIEYCTPCWSLVALLCVLPKDEYKDVYLCFGGYQGDKYISEWFCSYEQQEPFIIEVCHADNPVDACYKMIVKLNELKML